MWEAITTGPGVDSWLMGRAEVDSASKTSTFNMFGEVSRSSITAREPGHRYATREDKNPDGTFMAIEWLIESRDGGGAVVRFVHSGLLGDNWEADSAETEAWQDWLNGLAALAQDGAGLASTVRYVTTAAQAK